MGAWSTTTVLPTKLRGQGSVINNGYVYVMGGGTSSSNGSAVTAVRYAVINADGTLGAWTTTTALPKALANVAATSYNGYVYITGGTMTTGQSVSTVYYAKFNANGTLGAWATTTDMPVPPDQHTVAATNGYIYVNGTGWSGSTSYSAPINANGTLGSWTDVTNHPNYTDAPSLTNNGYIYFSGGQNGSNNKNPNLYYAKLNANGALGSWSVAILMPYAASGATMNGHGMVASNGFVYIVGQSEGGSGNYTTTPIFYAPFNFDGTIGY